MPGLFKRKVLREGRGRGPFGKLDTRAMSYYLFVHYVFAETKVLRKAGKKMSAWFV